MDFGVVLEIAILAVLAIGGYLLYVGREAFEAGVKASAEKGVEVAIKNVNWRTELAQELEKARGVERQEIRFKSYGALWTNMRPLAIFDRTVIDRSTSDDLSKRLSDWYFSEHGGLMLTQEVRPFYFALQELLRRVADAQEWEAVRPSDVQPD